MSSFLRHLAASAILALSVRAADPPCVETDPLTPPSICAVRAAFGGSLVVPDIIPSFLPVGELHTVYGTVDVGGAQQLSPSRVSNTPVISFKAVAGTSSGPKYILIMTDHDDGANSDVLHWLQTDLQVGDNDLLVTDVKAAAPYAGPAPSQGSGIHRYVTLLYTQPDDFVLPTNLKNLPVVPETGSARLKFSLTDFVSQNNLDGPAGGIFFKSQYDGVAIPSNSVSQTATIDPAAASSVSPSSSSSVVNSAISSSKSASSSVAPSATEGTQSSDIPCCFPMGTAINLLFIVLTYFFAEYIF